MYRPRGRHVTAGQAHMLRQQPAALLDAFCPQPLPTRTFRHCRANEPCRAEGHNCKPRGSARNRWSGASERRPAQGGGSLGWASQGASHRPSALERSQFFNLNNGADKATAGGPCKHLRLGALEEPESNFDLAIAARVLPHRLQRSAQPAHSATAGGCAGSGAAAVNVRVLKSLSVW